MRDIQIVGNRIYKNIGLTPIFIKAEIQAHNEFQESVLGRAVKEKVRIKDIDIRNYAKHILRKRPVYEKREVLSHLRSRLILKEKKLSLVA